MLRQVVLIEVEVQEEAVGAVVTMLAIAMVVAVGCGFCLAAVVAVVLNIDAAGGQNDQQGGQHHHGTFAGLGDSTTGATA